MSDPDPQECNCFDGTLVCTKASGVKKTQNLLSTFLLVKLVHLL